MIINNVLRTEILAPAGDFECLEAAIKGGANAIYFGLVNLNMRAGRAKNFSIEDLPEIVKRTHNAGVMCYLTLNIILFNEDLSKATEILDLCKEYKVDGIIVSDMSAMKMARDRGLSCHISVQQSVSNFESVKFFSEYADRITLARELSLKQIKEIYTAIKKENICGPAGKLIELEAFAHGALCIGVSGRCGMSLFTDNKSSCRGECIQNCRRAYKLVDIDHGNEIIIDNKYIMSPTDICTIEFLDRFIDAGVSVLKLEGRARSTEYVLTVTKVYADAVKSINNDTYSKTQIELWINELEKVFNRGFSSGYYLNENINVWSGKYGNHSEFKKTFIGKVQHYYKKPNVVEVLIQAGEIVANEELLITGNTTGAVKIKVSEYWVDDKPEKTAKKGDLITFKTKEILRKNDLLYVIREFKKEI